MNAPLTESWWGALQDLLNQDPAWLSAAKWFDGRLSFAYETDSASLEIRDGAAILVSHGPTVRQSSITVSGPRSEWLRVIEGHTDWFKATSPDVGRLVVGSDVVLAMRNANLLWLTFETMKRVDGANASRPDPSPEPPAKSGADIVGRYITVDGIRTYYEEAGNGPVVLCLHAASQDAMQYRHVLDSLSDQYRVIAFDAPGHCKSAVPDEGLFTDITQHAEFTEAFITALALDRPALIGCSFAGNEVLELASRRPGGYSAVVSAEGADYTPRFPEFVLDMFQSDGHQLLNGWARSLSGSRTPEHRLQEVVWQIKRTPPEVMVADLTAYGTFDEREQMRLIDCPVLLLRGEDDWLVTQDQVDETCARITQGKVAVLAGTGHYPMIENPVEFTNAVRAFLGDVGY